MFVHWKAIITVLEDVLGFKAMRVSKVTAFEFKSLIKTKLHVVFSQVVHFKRMYISVNENWTLR